MPNRPPRAVPTREHRPPTEEPESLGRPALLAAFPEPVSVALPASSEPVGYDWLADAGRLDDEVSGRHIHFYRTRGRLDVEDAGSTNGTYVDGHRLAPRERVTLEDGGVLRLGETLLVYRGAFTGPDQPRPPLGSLVGPWGLEDLHGEIANLSRRPVRREHRLNVLVLGESGTGKQLLAEEIARVLGRGKPRFGEINLAAIPADRIEAELFGWEKGAFTGGQQAHPGVIRGAGGGAVFLDEIGELPIALQAKLLRLLENHEVQPLGAMRAEAVDVVLIAATNRALDEEVKAGGFRLDLHARFSVRLSLPRLADRPEDLFAILGALYRRAHGGQELVKVRVEVIELLMLHDFPGNVRDLDRLVQAVDPRVGLKLPLARQVLEIEGPDKARPLSREAVAAALAKHNGNQSRAARELGVSRPRLLRAMKKT